MLEALNHPKAFARVTLLHDVGARTPGNISHREVPQNAKI